MPLEDLMNRVMELSDDMGPNNFFPIPHHEDSDFGIQLRKTEENPTVNHILVFQGVFNPPHVGHLASFYTALKFAKSCAGLNIVAAVVSNLSDSYLEAKNKEAGKIFVVE